MSSIEHVKRAARRSWAVPAARVLVFVLLPLLVAAVVAACDSGSSGSGSNSGSGQTATRAPYEGIPEGKPTNLGGTIPDPKEVLETKPAGQLPDFLAKAPPNLKDKLTAEYQGAVDHYDEFNQIPCYCGCAMYTHAHRSLASCYIKERKPNGDIVFTDHSVSCDICQQDAEMTLLGITSGKPLKDTRADVYNKFKYTGVWTDTPPISDK